MKRVDVAIRGEDRPLHPMVPFLTSDAVEAAEMVDWNGVTYVDGPDESTVVHRIRAPPERVREAFANEPVVDDFDCSVVDEDCCYVQVHSETVPIEGRTAKALTPPGVVVVPPVRYESDGWLTLTLVGDDRAVQDALDAVPESVAVDVRSVDSRGYGATDPLEALSTRQREAVLAAVDCGYYAVPREASVEAVAESLGCAPSTAAEHLRKAEARLLTDLATRTRR